MALDSGFDASRFIPKQNLLPNTVERTPLVEVAASYNTKIAYATAENLKASLPKTDFKVRSADHIAPEGTKNFERTKDSKNVISTEADPAVIVLFGASFCSLMLAKDDKGNAVGTHQPITFEEGHFSSIKRAITEMKSFFSGIIEVVKNNKGFLLVSGVNPFSLDDDNQRHLVSLAQKQISKTNLDLVKLFIKSTESEYVQMRPALNKLKDMGDFFVNHFPAKKSVIPKNIRTIDGLIYVPRQIDKKGVDRIFVMDRTTDNSKIEAALFAN